RCRKTFRYVQVTKPRKYCSPECRSPGQRRPAPRLVECENCGEPFYQRPGPDKNGLIQRTCSRKCGVLIRFCDGRTSDVGWVSCAVCRGVWVGRRRFGCRGLRPTRPCAECGKPIEQKWRSRYCGDGCATKASNRMQRHRERDNGKRNQSKRTRYQRQQQQRTGPTFTLLEIAVRDGWKCHICHKPVSRATWSMDHLVPLVDGGPHSRENVALAHHLCNSIRSEDR